MALSCQAYAFDSPRAVRRRPAAVAQNRRPQAGTGNHETHANWGVHRIPAQSLLSKLIGVSQWISVASEPHRIAAPFKEKQNDRRARREFGEHAMRTSVVSNK